MTVSDVSLAYYLYIMPYGLAKLVSFATEGWGVDPEGKTDEQTAEEGLKKMEEWMKTLGLTMNLTDLGVTEDMIDGIADGTFILEGGYKVLTKDEVKEILRASM